jgi:hypothetical protein
LWKENKGGKMKELEREIELAINDISFFSVEDCLECKEIIKDLIQERDKRILENTIKCIEKNRDKFNRSGALGNIDLITQIFADLEKEESQ